LVHALQTDQSLVWQSTAQQCVLQVISVSAIVSTGHAAPPNAAATDTPRMRVVLPEPQGCEHEPHSPHGSISQSNGHVCVLHVWVAATEPHWAPEHTGATSTERDLSCEPPPHVLVHWLHGDHSERTQSTGQQLVLHESVSVSWAGHVVPPQLGDAVIARERCFSPVPQGVLHSPQAPHAETAQSTGQQCSLQSWLATVARHALPAQAGATMIERERDCVPLPHDLVQVL
jgi:hypothetical protein